MILWEFSDALDELADDTVFVINVKCTDHKNRWIHQWRLWVDWEERWIYCDAQKFFPVDSLEDLLNWIKKNDPEP